MDKFGEIFHHTQPVEFYEDFNEGSLRNLERSSLSEVFIPNRSEPELALESYGKMLTPQSFDGKTDPRIWIQHYEVIAEANLWDDDMKARRLISSLDGAAQHWLLNQRLVNQNLNWKQLKEKLINRFSKSIDGLIIIDSDKLTLKKTEDFDNYWEKKMALFKLRSPNITQKEMMQKLFDGLNKELKSQVLSKIVERKAETVSELYKLIKEIIDIEQYKKEMQSSNKKRSENYHKNAELKDNASEFEPMKYKELKQKMAKIKDDLREIKSLIIDDRIENQEENDAELKEEEEVESSEEEEKHELADEKSDSSNSERESEPSESENEGDLNDIFKDKEDII